MAVGRAQKKIVDVAHGVARVSRNPNTDADQLRPLLNVGGHVAGQEIIKRFGDRLRVHAFEAGLYAIDLNVERVACRHDSVLNLDYAANFRNRVGHSQRKRAQELFVIRIKLDLNRLWHAGEIADQIFHQLQQLDLKTGNMLFDFTANIVHHLFNSAARERL